MVVNHVFNGVITGQEISEHLKLGEDCLLQQHEVISIIMIWYAGDGGRDFEMMPNLQKNKSLAGGCASGPTLIDAGMFNNGRALIGKNKRSVSLGQEDDLRPCLGPIAATRPGHMELIINTVERVSGLGAAVSEESSASGPYAAGGPDCCVVRASGLADGVNCDDGLNVKCADPDQESKSASRLDAVVEKSARVPVEEVVPVNAYSDTEAQNTRCKPEEPRFNWGWRFWRCPSRH
ncbi:hypothetical protein SESBI_22604 [Sesbania bispinosa]|nr:hypothetical protein SESBI_22604 [Sesbania bispinosa]